MSKLNQSNWLNPDAGSEKEIKDIKTALLDKASLSNSNKFVSVQTFLKRGNAIVLDNSGAIFIEFQENAVRHGYFGRGSSSSKNITLESSEGILLNASGILTLTGLYIDCNQKRLANIATPSVGGDAVTKDYADAWFLNSECTWNGTNFVLRNTTTIIAPKRFLNVSVNSLARVFVVVNRANVLELWEKNATTGQIEKVTTVFNIWLRLLKE